LEFIKMFCFYISYRRNMGGVSVALAFNLEKSLDYANLGKPALKA